MKQMCLWSLLLFSVSAFAQVSPDAGVICPPYLSTVSVTALTYNLGSDGDYYVNFGATGTLTNSTTENLTSAGTWTSNSPSVFTFTSTKGQAKILNLKAVGSATFNVTEPVYVIVEDSHGDIGCQVQYVSFPFSFDIEYATSSLLRLEDLACVGSGDTEVCNYSVTPSCSNVPVYAWANIDYLPPHIQSAGPAYAPSSWQVHTFCERFEPGTKWACLGPPAAIAIPNASNPTYCTYNP